jgi:Mn-dependent DtxR family transcriptional regulator
MQRLTASGRRNINIILRRMRHLETRFSENPALSWDIAEHAALRWALEELGVLLQPAQEATGE